MKHLFFDLDDFLVRTSHLAPYRLNAAGRRFVAQNPLSVSSSVIGDMKTVVDQIDTIDSLKFHVLTNSASDYAKALLEKHEFPDSVIIANAQKPNSATFKKFLQQI